MPVEAMTLPRAAPTREPEGRVGTRGERTGRSRGRVCRAPVDSGSPEARPTARVPNTRHSSEGRDLGWRVAAGHEHDHPGGAAPLKRVAVWVRIPPEGTDSIYKQRCASYWSAGCGERWVGRLSAASAMAGRSSAGSVRVMVTSSLSSCRLIVRRGLEQGAQEWLWRVGEVEP